MSLHFCFIPGPAELGYALPWQCRSRSVGSLDLHCLFVIKYVNLYIKISGSSNVIGRKFEMGVASYR